ncbi:MAG: class I SAM-dependent methyltransferase, partial [Proteobacteria bacterium]|nr:class I SAM-dependent methyltransferase [Pseudomonadota bacterium]
LPPDERNISVRRSMFDPAWMREIRDKHPHAPILVLSEGVLMYFSEDAVRPLIKRIAEVLAPGELLFDACTGFGCRISSRHDTIKHTRARFLWAMDEDKRLELWAYNLSLNSVEYYMDKEPRRWDFLSRVMARIPAFAKAFRILHYQMNPAGA